MTHLLNIEFPVLRKIHQTVKDRKELYLVLGTCEDAVSKTRWRSLVKTFIVKKKEVRKFPHNLHYLVIFFYSCPVVTFFSECCYLLNNFLFSVGKPVPPIRRSGLRTNTRRMSRHV